MNFERIIPGTSFSGGTVKHTNALTTELTRIFEIYNTDSKYQLKYTVYRLGLLSNSLTCNAQYFNLYFENIQTLSLEIGDSYIQKNDFGGFCEGMSKHKLDNFTIAFYNFCCTFVDEINSPEFDFVLIEKFHLQKLKTCISAKQGRSGRYNAITQKQELLAFCALMLYLHASVPIDLTLNSNPIELDSTNIDLLLKSLLFLHKNQIDNNTKHWQKAQTLFVLFSLMQQCTVAQAVIETQSVFGSPFNPASIKSNHLGCIDLAELVVELQSTRTLNYLDICQNYLFYGISQLQNSNVQKTKLITDFLILRTFATYSDANSSYIYNVCALYEHLMNLSTSGTLFGLLIRSNSNLKIPQLTCISTILRTFGETTKTQTAKFSNRHKLICLTEHIKKWTNSHRSQFARVRISVDTQNTNLTYIGDRTVGSFCSNNSYSGRSSPGIQDIYRIDFTKIKIITNTTLRSALNEGANTSLFNKNANKLFCATLNYLDNSKFQINSEVLEILEYYFQSDVKQLLGTSDNDNKVLAKFEPQLLCVAPHILLNSVFSNPHEYTPAQLEQPNTKAKRKFTYKKNSKITSKMSLTYENIRLLRGSDHFCKTQLVLQEARRLFLSKHSFKFSYKCCSRLRFYIREIHFNYQSERRVRGLLKFVSPTTSNTNTSTEYETIAEAFHKYVNNEPQIKLCKILTCQHLSNVNKLLQNVCEFVNKGIASNSPPYGTPISYDNVVQISTMPLHDIIANAELFKTGLLIEHGCEIFYLLGNQKGENLTLAERIENGMTRFPSFLEANPRNLEDLQRGEQTIGLDSDESVTLIELMTTISNYYNQTVPQLGCDLTTSNDVSSSGVQLLAVKLGVSNDYFLQLLNIFDNKTSHPDLYSFLCYEFLKQSAQVGNHFKTLLSFSDFKKLFTRKTFKLVVMPGTYGQTISGLVDSLRTHFNDNEHTAKIGEQLGKHQQVVQVDTNDSEHNENVTFSGGQRQLAIHLMQFCRSQFITMNVSIFKYLDATSLFAKLYPEKCHGFNASGMPICVYKYQSLNRNSLISKRTNTLKNTELTSSARAQILQKIDKALNDDDRHYIRKEIKLYIPGLDGTLQKVETYLRVGQPTGDINTTKLTRGLNPHVIHSTDADLLICTIAALKKIADIPIGVIHDCILVPLRGAGLIRLIYRVEMAKLVQLHQRQVMFPLDEFEKLIHNSTSNLQNSSLESIAANQQLQKLCNEILNERLINLAAVNEKDVSKRIIESTNLIH